MFIWVGRYESQPYHWKKQSIEASILRLGQWLGLLTLVISLYILWQIRQVVLLLFAAVVLATVLNQVVRRIQQYSITEVC